MYLVRRVYKTKPGQARKVATIVQEQGDMYNEAGQRSEVRVYFNGGTVPGENNVVYLEWIDEKIDSPYREGNKIRVGNGEKIILTTIIKLICQMNLVFFRTLLLHRIQIL